MISNTLQNNDCIFCRLLIEQKNIVLINNYCFVIYDGFPVSKGHSLIIPKRHFGSFFELTEEELSSIHDLLKIMQKTLSSEDKSIDGFNIGINSGKSAGQTIMHLHVHLIPRRTGDIENPKGGVRGVIPNKMKY
jgi:diadenosine tetraphosphate (Ap4A) HIT family hydrolase